MCTRQEAETLSTMGRMKMECGRTKGRSAKGYAKSGRKKKKTSEREKVNKVQADNESVAQVKTAAAADAALKRFVAMFFVFLFQLPLHRLAFPFARSAVVATITTITNTITIITIPLTAYTDGV